MTWDAWGRAQFRISMLIGKLEMAEFEYYIEKGKREAKGLLKASTREAMKMRQIRNYIASAREIERTHNRLYPKHELDEFRGVVEIDPKLTISKRLVAQHEVHKDRMRKAQYIRRQSVMYKNADLLEKSPSQIEEMRQQILDNSIDDAKQSTLDEVDEMYKNFLAGKKKEDEGNGDA